MWVRVVVRIAWAALGVVLVTFGVLGALAMPMGLLVFWGLLGLVIGIAAWRAAVGFPAVRHLVDRRKPDVWTGIAIALAFVLLCLAIAGLVTVVDATTATALLAALAAVAAWIGWRTWRVTNVARPAGVTPAEPPPAGPPPTPRAQPTNSTRDLPTDELCLAWRRSYLQLQRAADERTRQQIIRARQECLDELERRDRPGFARWLASGARAGSDPRRYLSPGG